MNHLLLPAATAAALGDDMHIGEVILFAVVACVTLACGIGLLTAKRAVNAAVNMIMIMISLAILYIANSAPFLGIVQGVVYTGAVMTLVLFVIMLVGVGTDEKIVETVHGQKAIAVVLGLAMSALLIVAASKAAFPPAVGLNTEESNPTVLAELLFSSHVVTMELTAILLITAAVGALTLTHRDRIRPRKSQLDVAKDKMIAYAESGVHPGQDTFSGVYAATNSAAAPALDAAGQPVEESVSRVLKVRGDDLDVSDLAPRLALAGREGEIEQVHRRQVPRSGMPAMPGSGAPVPYQPVAPVTDKPEPLASAEESKEDESK
ncbi:NADH-quinone oxidoreductase subunit J [Actinomyces vulturis]|uniref:NADH-quinone oxidoreductase subunit J n=1 Tax=Actinomyces vulturis TaxID=1857645 RepID=UPI0008338833|nr:NADH-quinone oxidoreductase subunit J [Actinomyces vulturis]